MWRSDLSLEYGFSGKQVPLCLAFYVSAGVEVGSSCSHSYCPNLVASALHMHTPLPPKIKRLPAKISEPPERCRKQNLGDLGGKELRSLQEPYAFLTMELFLQSQNSPFKISSYIRDRKYKKKTNVDSKV